MTGQELIQAILETRSQANDVLESLHQAAIDKAEAEADYRSKLAAEELRLREAGYPATMIRDLARGGDEVCEAQVRRDESEALYEATREELMLRKVEMKLLNDMVNREWSVTR